MDSIIKDKDTLKPIIDTSNAEYKEMIKMVNQSADNNKQENKFKNVSDDEIYAELKRRKANKSAK